MVNYGLALMIVSYFVVEFVIIFFFECICERNCCLVYNYGNLSGTTNKKITQAKQTIKQQ